MENLKFKTLFHPPFQNNDKVSIVVARKPNGASLVVNYDEVDQSENGDDEEDEISSEVQTETSSTNGFVVSHTRSKSAPAIQPKKNGTARRDSDDDDEEDDDTEDESEHEPKRNGTTNGATNGKVKHQNGQNGARAKMTNGKSDRKSAVASHEDLTPNEPLYDTVEGEDYLAIYETLDRVKERSHRKKESSDLKNKSHSMEALETPTPSLKSFEFPDTIDSPKDANKHVDQKSAPSAVPAPAVPRRRHRSKPQTDSAMVRQSEHRRSVHEMSHREQFKLQRQPQKQDTLPLDPAPGSMAAFLKKALRIEGPQLQQRTVAIKKNVRESLGMRIGGGIGSNEGDTPIYIANIHPHGCIGKSKQMKVK